MRMFQLESRALVAFFCAFVLLMLEKSNKDGLPPDLVGIDVLFPLVG
jgi:hypothetical protein